MAKRARRWSAHVIRTSAPFRSAMSMLNFHINRSGRGLSAQRREILERAKGELRRLFGREG